MLVSLGQVLRQIALEMLVQIKMITEECKEQIGLEDSKGLICSSHMESLGGFKAPWGHEQGPSKSLLCVVEPIKPSLLSEPLYDGEIFRIDLVSSLIISPA